MGLIPEDIIAQVIERCDVVEFISSYIPLKRAGRNFKALCPFHPEKTPSFVVNPDKQIFHCFGCGAGGSIVSFVMQHERLDFPEAIRLLARQVNVTIPEETPAHQAAGRVRQEIVPVNALAAQYFHHILLSDKSPASQTAREYLKQRRVSLETVKQFQLGFAPDQWDGLLTHLKKHNISLSLMEKSGLIIARDGGQGYYDRFRRRIIFPIFDHRAQCVAFGGRILESGADQADLKAAKYINSPETPVYTKGNHLYGFHLAKQAIGQQDSVIVVEGYMDCVMPHQTGIGSAVAALGTALTVEQVRLIRRYTRNIVLLFDMDPAGEAAMMRSLDMLIEEGMDARVATLEEGEDPDSFICRYGVEEFKNKVVTAPTLFEYKLCVLKKQHDARTVEGKAKICDAMLATISKFDNAVLVSGYLRRLADDLNVPETSLVTEIKKYQKGAGGPNLKWSQTNPAGSGQPSAQEVKQKPRGAEFHILKLLLSDEEVIHRTAQELAPEDFCDHQIRIIVTKIFEDFARGKRIHLGTLVSDFKDKEIQCTISSLMAEELNWPKDKERLRRDCVERIKQDRLKLLRKELRQEIQQAEAVGDIHTLEDLKQKFNELIKK